MPERQSNNPKRRIAEPGSWTHDRRETFLAAAKYLGSAIHKKYPGDYGFDPPVNPRPSKSLCDDLRPILQAEARALFAAGVRKAMVSTHIEDDGRPKYVWSVGHDGEVYEAKWDREGYHGYRLDKESEKHQRDCVLKAWSER